MCFQRDAKRRLTHNEVERRRRDKINQWIMYMSKIIPDCAEENKTNYDNQVLRTFLFFFYTYSAFIYLNSTLNGFQNEFKTLCKLIFNY